MPVASFVGVTPHGPVQSSGEGHRVTPESRALCVATGHQITRPRRVGGARTLRRAWKPCPFLRRMRASLWL